MARLRYVVVVLSVLLVSCGPAARPAPTPDVSKLIAAAVAATVAAFPTQTPRPTQTALPTYTPLPTYTALPTATPTPSPMPTPTPSLIAAVRPITMTATVNANCNKRGGPGTDNPIVGTLKAGDIVRPIGRNQSGDWYQLDDTGWVLAALVPVPDAAALPIVGPTASPTHAAQATATFTPTQEAPAQGSLSLLDIPHYRVAATEDLNLATAVRVQYRILVDQKLSLDQLALICQDVIARVTQPVNAISFMFYLPDTDTNGPYTAGTAAWAPNGVWADAVKVRTGDYSHHKLVVSVGNATGPTAEPARSTIPEATRQP
jgi:hypothetical protein